MRKIIPAIAAMVIAGVVGTVHADAGMKGTVTVIRKGDVTIHSYLSPENGAAVTSQIIETKNKLYIVDAQFLRPYAQELSDYAKSLKKPVERIIITHSHPDHWFGLELFPKTPVYATREVTAEIEKFGDFFVKSKREVLKDLVTDRKIVPTKTINEGKDSLDGVSVDYISVSDAESGNQLVMVLSQEKTLIAQDLIYNRTHNFLGQNAFDGWIAALKKLKAAGGIDTVLCGHGMPSDQKIIDGQIAYLEYAKKSKSSAKNGSDFKSLMTKKYSDYQGAILIDLSLPLLYKN